MHSLGRVEKCTLVHPAERRTHLFVDEIIWIAVSKSLHMNECMDPSAVSSADNDCCNNANDTERALLDVPPLVANAPPLFMNPQRREKCPRSKPVP